MNAARYTSYQSKRFAARRRAGDSILSDSWPWLVGGGGVIAAFAAMLFAASQNQELENTRGQLGAERQVTEHLKTLQLTARDPQSSASPSQREQLSQTIDQLTGELARTVLDRDQLRRTLSAQLEQQQQLMPLIGQSSEQIDAEAGQPAAPSRSFAKLESQHVALQERNAGTQQQLAEAQSAIAKQQLKYRAVESDRNTLRERLAAASETSVPIGQFTAANAINSTLTDALGKAEDSLSVVKTQLISAEQRIAELSTLNAALNESEERAPGKPEAEILRAQLRATQAKADQATAMVHAVAQRLDFPVSGEDWAKPGSSTSLALIEKLDQALLKPPADSERAGEYFDGIERRAQIERTLAAVGPPQRVPAGNAVKLHELHFSTGSTTLTPAALRKAREVSQVFEKENLKTIRVMGFSDTTGSAQRNLQLSRARADAVAQLLVRAGVPADRIEIIAKGEKDLPEATADGVDEPLNRCVGIFAQP